MSNDVSPVKYSDSDSDQKQHVTVTVERIRMSVKDRSDQIMHACSSEPEHIRASPQFHTLIIHLNQPRGPGTLGRFSTLFIYGRHL